MLSCQRRSRRAVSRLGDRRDPHSKSPPMQCCGSTQLWNAGATGGLRTAADSNCGKEACPTKTWPLHRCGWRKAASSRRTPHLRGETPPRGSARTRRHEGWSRVRPGPRCQPRPSIPHAFATGLQNCLTQETHNRLPRVPRGTIARSRGFRGNSRAAFPSSSELPWRVRLSASERGTLSRVGRKWTPQRQMKPKPRPLPGAQHPRPGFHVRGHEASATQVMRGKSWDKRAREIRARR
jgi:hypothetical protein